MNPWLLKTEQNKQRRQKALLASWSPNKYNKHRTQLQFNKHSSKILEASEVERSKRISIKTNDEPSTMKYPPVATDETQLESSQNYVFIIRTSPSAYPGGGPPKYSTAKVKKTTKTGMHAACFVIIFITNQSVGIKPSAGRALLHCFSMPWMKTLHD